MDGFATNQEYACEHIYHFPQHHLNLSASSVTHIPSSSLQQCQSVSSYNPHIRLDDDVIDRALMHPLIQRSMSVLYHMPAYCAHTLELIAASRRSEVTRRFLLVLTHGYNGLLPIEMRVHDPINYVGNKYAFFVILLATVIWPGACFLMKRKMELKDLSLRKKLL
eukprot:1043321-Ditylum_brightwellii.AAC.1